MSTGNKTHTLSFRLAEDDFIRLSKRCASAELSKSKYLRYLIRIPVLAEKAHGGEIVCVVLDRKSLRRISRELTKWGYHYNQAVHAMNSINYHIAHGKTDQDFFDGKAETIARELTSVNKNAERIMCELASLSSSLVIEAS